jgi:DNA uptake protein ComE-like DNA-binding protein
MSQINRHAWAIALMTLFVFALAGCFSSSTQTVSPPSTDQGSGEPENTELVKLNLNTATGDDFQALIPDFSDRMVREFLEYRPYISIQQFRQEIGKYVDEAQVAEYEKYVYVPVNINDSDAETLKQLPGVDDAIAAELIAARPFGSNDVFLTKLADYISEADLTIAATYLAP